MVPTVPTGSWAAADFRYRGRSRFPLPSLDGHGRLGCKVETWAASGSMTPRIFCRASTWTQDPQLSKKWQVQLPGAAVESNRVSVVVALKRDRELFE